MRKFVCSLLSLTTLVLAGCQSGSSDQASVSDSTASEVTGKVSLHAGSPAPSANAMLELSVVDAAAQGGAPLGKQEIKPVTSFPLDYRIAIHAKDVNPADIYVVHAQLIDGDRRYTVALQTPVLTQGKGATADVELVAQATAGEKEWADFQALRKRLGGLKVSNGSKLEGQTARAWQVFREGHTIKLIRELVDDDSKHFTATDFAYTDEGKLWAVEQAQKANEKAATSASLQAAWDPSGKQVVGWNKAGGKSTPLSGEDAQALQQQAKTILALVGGK